jgi:hypothetical protein
LPSKKSHWGAVNVWPAPSDPERGLPTPGFGCMPHSSKGSIAALDARTTVAKLLRKITDDLLDHLGDPTAPQRIIVQGAAFKALRVALFADKMLNDSSSLSETSDHNLLACSNSLRLDLQALGLERREKPTLHLASYLARGAGAGVTDIAAPLLPSVDAATWQWGKMSQLGRVGSILGAAMNAGLGRNGVSH